MLFRSPSHTHTPTVNLTDNGHTHDIPQNFLEGGNCEGGIQGSEDWCTSGGKKTGSNKTGIEVAVTIGNTGGGLPHDNKQPVLACYYIMYIP